MAEGAQVECGNRPGKQFPDTGRQVLRQTLNGAGRGGTGTYPRVCGNLKPSGGSAGNTAAPLPSSQTWAVLEIRKPQGKDNYEL